MTASDPSDRTELTDDRLDSLLRYADDELLHHIQATVDPAITLTAVMNIGAAHAEQTHPGEPAYADLAAALIMRRRVLIQTSRTLARALDVARDLDLDLARALAHAPDRVLGLTYARALVRDLNRALDLALDLDLDLARYLDLALDYASALNRAFASALEPGRTLDLASALDRARDLALARNLASALASALNRAHHLAEREIIASGADLSLLAIDDVEMVAGVIWDETTAWPPGIADRVRAASQEIRPGVYRVGGGAERDPAECARH